MADHPHESEPDARVTSPMQEFTTKQAMTGGLVRLAGLLDVCGNPLVAL